jgi:hypothetical protein
MKLKLEIKMDNAAFEDHPGSEVARILRDFADTIEEVPMPVGSSESLRDINGNTVGQAKITR